MASKEKLGTKMIDDLGRILLPREIREKFGWEAKDTLDMYYVDSNTLMLRLAEKYQGDNVCSSEQPEQ